MTIKRQFLLFCFLFSRFGLDDINKHSLVFSHWLPIRRHCIWVFFILYRWLLPMLYMFFVSHKLKPKEMVLFTYGNQNHKLRPIQCCRKLNENVVVVAVTIKIVSLNKQTLIFLTKWSTVLFFTFLFSFFFKIWFCQNQQ